MYHTFSLLLCFNPLATLLHRLLIFAQSRPSLYNFGHLWHLRGTRLEFLLDQRVVILFAPEIDKWWRFYFRAASEIARRIVKEAFGSIYRGLPLCLLAGATIF